MILIRIIAKPLPGGTLSPGRPVNPASQEPALVFKGCLGHSVQSTRPQDPLFFRISGPDRLSPGWSGPVLPKAYHSGTPAAHRRSPCPTTLTARRRRPASETATGLAVLSLRGREAAVAISARPSQRQTSTTVQSGCSSSALRLNACHLDRSGEVSQPSAESVSTPCAFGTLRIDMTEDRPLSVVSTALPWAGAGPPAHRREWRNLSERCLDFARHDSTPAAPLWS